MNSTKPLRLLASFSRGPNKSQEGQEGFLLHTSHLQQAASAALPVLTMLADDAEAAYGDSRKWSLGKCGRVGESGWFVWPKVVGLGPKLIGLGPKSASER